MKHQSFPPHLVVKCGIHGLGIFTLIDINPGEIIFEMHGKVLSYTTRTSVQIGKEMHIENIVAGHVNHSCEPSAKVCRRERVFRSLRKIAQGEEITFDYNENEDALAEPFVCECCGRKVIGKSIRVLELNKA